MREEVPAAKTTALTRTLIKVMTPFVPVLK
jgi:hypothetical protein